MFNPRLIYAERETHRQTLLDEAAHDRLAASLTTRRQNDHPLLGNLLMTIGATLLTWGMRMNMHRLLATAEPFDAGYTRYVSDGDPVRVPKPRQSKRLADCA